MHDDLPHRSMVGGERTHDLFRLPTFGKRREAAKVKVDYDDLAPMALKGIAGGAADDKLRHVGRKKSLEP